MKLIEVDKALRNMNLVHRNEVTELQDEHNVNLNASGEGDEFLDGSDDPYVGLSIIDGAEFFQRYFNC